MHFFPFIVELHICFITAFHRAVQLIQHTIWIFLIGNILKHLLIDYFFNVNKWKEIQNILAITLVSMIDIGWPTMLLQTLMKNCNNAGEKLLFVWHWSFPCVFWEIDMIKALRDQYHYQLNLSYHTPSPRSPLHCTSCTSITKNTMLSEKEQTQWGDIEAKRLETLHFWDGLPYHLLQSH